MAKKRKLKPLLARSIERHLERHLKTAEAYLVDGAPHSALCHVKAAQLVLKGEPVPIGPEFWKLAGTANSID